MRVLEGLEGASTHAGSQFDRGQMEKTLAGLGSRVFLMNNVHESHPVLFETRWAMSYLRGPLTRKQLQKLTQLDTSRENTESQEKTTAPAAPSPAQLPSSTVQQSPTPDSLTNPGNDSKFHTATHCPTRKHRRSN